MSASGAGISEPAPYDDEEEIQLMDTDATGLQFDEQFLETKPVEREEKQEKVSSLLVIDKLKVYLRDGPNAHHVATIHVEEKYYDLPNKEELASIGSTEENYNELLESLNLKREDFRNATDASALSRPESLYIRGVNNMSTQAILNYFEEFRPHGIEWISDQACNLFWNETLTPFQLLASKTQRRSVNAEQTVRSGKRKASAMLNDEESRTADPALPPGHWREGTFQAFDQADLTAKFSFRYSTVDDRKMRGAETQSEYYREHGNPNYNNLTGLISRSRKRLLNAKRFSDFKVVKSNDRTATGLVEELPSSTAVAEENAADPKVKFTVVLPPKKSSPSREEEEEDDEGEHRSKRQRRRRSSASEHEDEDDQQQQQRRRREQTHFTVTIDSATKRSQDSKTRQRRSSPEEEEKDSRTVLDAREILERKRRSRK